MAKRGRDSSSPAPSPVGPTHRTPDHDPHGLWPLLHRLMTPTFPLRRCLCCPSDLIAERRLALFRPGQPHRTSRHLSEPRPGFTLQSTVLHRHLLCAHFHQTGGDQPCRCRCRSRVSPQRISLGHWIPPHLVAIQLYPSSLGSRSSTLCYDLAEFDSENSCTVMSSSPVSEVVSVVPVRAGLRHSTPRSHRCLQRLWTRGLWSCRSLTLLSCLRICRLLRSYSHYSTPGCHRYLRRLRTGWLSNRRCPTSRLW